MYKNNCFIYKFKHTRVIHFYCTRLRIRKKVNVIQRANKNHETKKYTFIRQSNKIIIIREKEVFFQKPMHAFGMMEGGYTQCAIGNVEIRVLSRK